MNALNPLWGLIEAGYLYSCTQHPTKHMEPQTP
jgi:hypothetical protein